MDGLSVVQKPVPAERFFIKRAGKLWHVMDHARPGHYILHGQPAKEVVRVVAMMLNSYYESGEFRPEGVWPPSESRQPPPEVA